jgi:para-nitrobenzyl esterase
MQNRFFLAITVLLCAFSTSLSAQSAPVSGCDGNRYVKQVFTEHEFTTEIYGSNIGAAGGAATPMYIDVYTPKGDTAKLRPVVVLAHGGTFIFGDRADMADYCIDLAKRGYVAVSVQYRLWPVFQLGFPDSTKIMRQAIMAMGDMKAAIRHMRMDAATNNKYKIHPDWVFCGGYSAGAVAALSVAQMDLSDPLQPFIATAVTSLGGIEGNTGSAANQTYSSDVKGVISLSGGMYDPTWIDSNDKPMFSIHGTSDATVFYTSGLAAGLVTLHGSGDLHQRANTVGIQNYLKTVPGGGHTDVYSSAAFAPALTEFFNTSITSLHNMFCTPLDANEPLAALDWSLQPNPTSGAVSLVLPEHIQQARVLVYSASGKLQLSASHQNGSTFSLEHLAAGLYFVQVQSSEGQLVVKKLIKE